MSKKELRRKTLLDAVCCGKLTLKDCSEKPDISYRQGNFGLHAQKKYWRNLKIFLAVNLEIFHPGSRLLLIMLVKFP